MKFRKHEIEVVSGLYRQGLDGQCFYNPPAIEIGAHCRGKRELDTLIHEMLHAAHPKMIEKEVHDTARDIAKVLWKWGYRKI